MNTISWRHTAQGIGLSQRITMPFGMTVEEMALATHNSLEALTAWVRAPAGAVEKWWPLPRHLWKRVRPKTDDAILLGYRLGESALRDVFALASAVLITVAGAFLTPILGPIGAAIATAGLGLLSSLAVNALFPAQQAQTTSNFSPSTQAAKQFANVDSDSNILAKEAYLPIVIGTRRISPPELATPFFTLENGTQTVKRVFGLDGGHELTDIRVDGVPVSDFSSITTEVRDGLETSSVTTFVDKITKLDPVGQALSTFSTDGVDLVDQEVPANSEPRWVRFITAYDPKLEEITVRIQLDSFIKSDSASQKIRVPFRMRFRPKGTTDTWFDLPETHLIGNDPSTSLKEIRIRWDESFGGEEEAGDIEYQFFQNVPPAAYTLSNGGSGDQWQADAHFVLGSGLRDTQNIQGRRNGLRVTFDEAVYPKQEYEWEIVRGIATTDTGLASSTYVLSGAVNSLFVARYTSSKWQIPFDQGAYVARLTVGQATSIVDADPCQRPKTALVALKSVGQSVKNITVSASRKVYDWDGSGWNTLTTTANPATHYRQVLSDYLDYHGIDKDLITNTELVSWRAECATRGYEVSAVSAGSSVIDVLNSIATAGFARPRFSEGFGVDWFRDRSAELPVQTVSPRNSFISVEWVAPETPVGTRAKFQNQAKDYRDDELQINNPFYANFSGYEVKEYASISNPALIEQRALFDIMQTYYQGRRAWVVEGAIEHFMCERGDLVNVVSDLFNDTHSGARIRKVIDSTTFTIDQEIPASDTTEIFSVGNIFDAENIFNTGAQTICLVSTPNGMVQGTIVAAEQNADGNVIRLDTALKTPDGIDFPLSDIVGAHIVMGPLDQFTARCIVSEVQRNAEERATLILVDEAPEIFTEMQKRFYS